MFVVVFILLGCLLEKRYRCDSNEFEFFLSDFSIFLVLVGKKNRRLNKCDQLDSHQLCVGRL